MKDIFKIQPFTYFDAANGKFVKADPKESHSFVSLINDIKSSGFKISTLQYLLGSNENGSANVNAIKETQLLDAIKMIRDGFNQINDDHPENEGTVIDDEVLRKKLSIIYSPETVEQLLGIFNAKALFGINTDKDLIIEIPEIPKKKVSYAKETGRL